MNYCGLKDIVHTVSWIDWVGSSQVFRTYQIGLARTAHDQEFRIRCTGTVYVGSFTCPIEDNKKRRKKYE